MKNCKSTHDPFMVILRSKYLLLVFLFAFGSCQKDPLHDVPIAAPSHDMAYAASSRSAGLESAVAEYAQWMITNAVPLVKDPLVYADLTSGNYATERVKAKLNTLGFSSYADFSAKLSAAGSIVTAAINSGELNKETLLSILDQRMSTLDITNMGRSTMAAGTPCYHQLMSHLALVAVDIAIASAAGPIAATIAGVVGVAAAYLDFNNCLHENYPGAY